jgi:hypothetical protein
MKMTVMVWSSKSDLLAIKKLQLGVATGINTMTPGQLAIRRVQQIVDPRVESTIVPCLTGRTKAFLGKAIKQS